MCGIYCKYIFNCNHSSKSKLIDSKADLVKLLKLRGPDVSGEISLSINENNSQNDFFEYMENETLQKEHKKSLEMYGCTLWMQGKSPEIQPIDLSHGILLFNGDLFNTEWVNEESDTRALIKRLNTNMQTDKYEASKHIISLLQSLNGPFSLIFLDKSSKQLYFCRDRIGRRSLLFYMNDESIILSSVLNRKYTSAVELPAGSIYCICLETNLIQEFSWDTGKNDSEISSIIFDDWFTDCLTSKNENISEDIKVNFTTITDHDQHIIDILNETADKFETQIAFLETVFKLKYYVDIVDELAKYLSESVKYRVTTQPNRCSKCINTPVKCKDHCTVGILFSGGLDCTILAALAHKFIPKEERIDLLNVAFSKKDNDSFNTPDRNTSKQSVNELCQLFPERCWNLIEINITTDELYEKQREIISDLIFPLQTILDESLGSALWFAALGKSSDYTSTCRILLTGIGADELFGGYTRHKNACRRQGWENLEKELYLDWKRIASRNLARDDRIISSHSRQPRMPYLDEKFVNFALKLKPWQKCFFSQNSKPGSGDKMILRLLALRLGLLNTAVLPKRALQFGSKIANKNENAKDISQRLLL